MRDMKKILFATVMSLFAIVMQAQDNALLQKVESANAGMPNIEAHFVQTKHLVATDKQIVTEGTLYIADNDKMAMYYNEPSSDLLVINGEQFYMKQGKRARLYNTAKNKPMASLSNTLLSCVRGKVADLAQQNNADITAQKGSKGYEVTLVSREKKAKGYAQIDLVYDAKSLILVYMKMTEFNGISNTYEMSQIKTGATIDAAKFQAPAK